MFRIMMKSKIHSARVTQCNLKYQGSLTVDSNLMEMADLIPNEKIQVVNVNTGGRFETYVIPGEPGSGIIGVNGGAARLAAEGDTILVISYTMMEEEKARAYQPQVILLDENNEPITPPQT
ncbi:MAG: aspartate 1-decarboxylase [Planctomycetes bacterium]|nr:aspartate 1-decarboxylase [Planctomycetota bacterium]